MVHAFYVNADGSGHIGRIKAICKHLEGRKVFFIHKSKKHAFSNIKDSITITLSTEYVKNAHAIAHKYLNNEISKEVAEEFFKNGEFYKKFKEYNLQNIHIDVGLKIAVACVLTDITYTYTHMHGKRNDVIHNFVYSHALKLLAPYSSEIESHEYRNTEHFKKTIYFGPIPPHQFSSINYANKKTHSLLCILGTGYSGGAYNNPLNIQLTQKIAENLNSYKVTCIGKSSIKPFTYKNYEYKGYVENPEKYISENEIIIGNCGYGIVAECSSANAKYIASPADTYNDEQLDKASILEQLGYTFMIKTESDIAKLKNISRLKSLGGLCTQKTTSSSVQSFFNE